MSGLRCVILLRLHRGQHTPFFLTCAEMVKIAWRSEVCTRDSKFDNGGATLPAARVALSRARKTRHVAPYRLGRSAEQDASQISIVSGTQPASRARCAVGQEQRRHRGKFSSKDRLCCSGQTRVVARLAQAPVCDMTDIVSDQKT